MTSCGRSWLTAASNTVCSGSVGLDSASWITGTLDAEYLMMSGGVMPGGSWRTCVCIDRHHLRERGLDVRGRLEEDLDDRDAGERVRLDVLDVAHRRRQAALALAGDALPHLLRRQAVVVPDDR